MQNTHTANVAIVHDSLTQEGGAERVLKVLHEIYPSAPVFVLVKDRRIAGNYAGWDIRTSWLQPLYNLFPRFQYFFPFIPLAVSSLSFDGFDLVISSSSSFAKNIDVPKGCTHICYCHTPTRFLWSDGSYVNEELKGLLRPLRPLARLMINVLKQWDYNGAQKVTQFVSNSKEVQKRIKKFYGRESVVIYPPIDTDFWHPTKQKSNYFLLVGRLQPHKKAGLAVEVFSQINVPLLVAGEGRQRKSLVLQSATNVKFLGNVSDEELRDLYSGALCLVFPQYEDLGLVPLEAAACGTPTLAFGQGGALETVTPGVTGEFFSEQSTESLKKSILAFKPGNYFVNDLINQSKKFSKANFLLNFKSFIKENHENHG